jgi:hypothetical protein
MKYCDHRSITHDDDQVIILVANAINYMFECFDFWLTIIQEN